jgi:hypothetical protein
MGKILRANVGKSPLAAGAGSNLQGLLKRDAESKARRASRVWRMSSDSVGINRRGAMNGKVIQGRGSDHPGPEPCEGGPQGRTRSVGQGNMRAGYRAPKYAKPGSRRCRTNRKATRRCATARVQRHPAESKNPRTHRYSVRENRETPLSPVAEKRRAGGRKREHISPTCTVAGSRTAE